MTRLYVDIKQVYLLTTQGYLGPVYISAQRLDLAMVLQVCEGDAAPRPLQQCLMAMVAVQVQWRGQLGLVEHDKIWLQFLDQPAQVPLLLVLVDAPDNPHEYRQVHLGHAEVTPVLVAAPVLVFSPLLCLLLLGLVCLSSPNWY